MADPSLSAAMAEIKANPSEKLKAHQRKIKLEYYSDPENRARVAKATKAAMARPEIRNKSVQGLRRFYENPDAREAARVRARRLREVDPEYDRKISISRKALFENTEWRARYRGKIAKAWTPERRSAASWRMKEAMADPERQKIQVARNERLANDPEYIRAASARTTAYNAKRREIVQIVGLRLKMLMADLTPPNGHASVNEWLEFNEDLDMMAAAGLVSVLAVNPNWNVPRNLRAEKAKEVGLRPEVRDQFLARIAKHNADPIAKTARVSKIREAGLKRRGLTAEKTREQYSTPEARQAQSERIRAAFAKRRAISDRCTEIIAASGLNVVPPGRKSSIDEWVRFEARIMSMVAAAR